MLLTVVSFLLALAVVVIVHEWGHFYAARCCGVQVVRFSLGFGPHLWSWIDRFGTQYTLAAIPLGGYVQMPDEFKSIVSCNQKVIWQRMVIVLAGPIANFLLAIFLYFFLAFFCGDRLTPVIGQITQENLAASGGVRVGDEIIAVDGNKTNTWHDVFFYLFMRLGDTGVIQLEVKTFGKPILESRYRFVSIPITRWLYDSDGLNFFNALGIEQYLPIGKLLIATVQPASAAEVAGIQSEDEIISVDGVLMDSWSQWTRYVQSRPEVPIDVELERQGKIVALVLTPEAVVSKKGKVVGFSGVSSRLDWSKSMIRFVDYSFAEAVLKAFKDIWEHSRFVVLFFKKLIFREVSIKYLRGTLSTAQLAGDSVRIGLASYLAFIASLSVTLGIFNLLPIPMLDGGHLFYHGIELIKGKPISEKNQQIFYRVGLFLLLSIMIITHFNDFVRIFL